MAEVRTSQMPYKAATCRYAKAMMFLQTNFNLRFSAFFSLAMSVSSPPSMVSASPSFSTPVQAEVDVAFGGILSVAEHRKTNTERKRAFVKDVWVIFGPC